MMLLAPVCLQNEFWVPDLEHPPKTQSCSTMSLFPRNLPLICGFACEQRARETERIFIELSELVLGGYYLIQSSEKILERNSGTLSINCKKINFPPIILIQQVAELEFRARLLSPQLMPNIGKVQSRSEERPWGTAAAEAGAPRGSWNRAANRVTVLKKAPPN